jgi:hypothetical protein
MLAIILFMYSCGLVGFVLDVWLFLSYSDVNARAVLATVVLDFTTVRHVPPHCAPSSKACTGLY